MGKVPLIVSITSEISCHVSGYPVLVFTGVGPSGQAPVVVDGGTVASSDPVSLVAVGPGDPASFLVQLQSVNGDGCPGAAGLMLGLPGTDATVPVTMAPPIGTGWPACPMINVTPFEQGNSPDRYA